MIASEKVGLADCDVDVYATNKTLLIQGKEAKSVPNANTGADGDDECVIGIRLPTAALLSRAKDTKPPDKSSHSCSGKEAYSLQKVIDVPRFKNVYSHLSNIPTDSANLIHNMESTPRGGSPSEIPNARGRFLPKEISALCWVSTRSLDVAS